MTKEKKKRNSHVRTLNMAGNKDAEKIVRIINRLYQHEHRIPPDWTARQILDYRNKYAPPILKELKEELISILLPDKWQRWHRGDAYISPHQSVCSGLAGRGIWSSRSIYGSRHM